MSNNSLLESAFAYADSGKAQSINDIRVYLAQHGYSQAQISQLGGAMLSSQLRARILAAAERQAQPAGAGGFRIG
jgi:hypothetical protein